MIWIIAGISIVAAFAIGYFLGSMRNIMVTVKADLVSTPKVDTSRPPLRAHNPDYETFKSAQEKEIES